MSDEPNYLAAPGEPVEAPLAIEKARILADLLREEKIEFATFVECRKTDGGEVVVFDVEVELGQIKANDIRSVERVSAEFFKEDNTIPDVLALRNDFPLVPHVNLRVEEFPRSLCLYDQPYRELKRQWTAPQFVERIRNWLRLTAKSKLHGKDQPLEPLLMAHAGYIVIPYGLTTAKDGQILRALYVTATSLEEGESFYVAQTARPKNTGGEIPFAACVLTCDTQQHGVVRRQPRTLAGLAELVGSAGLDLLDGLREQMTECKEELGEETGPFLDAPLIVIVRFPKARVAGGEAESTDIFVFLTHQSVREIGIDIGLWSMFEGSLAAVMEIPPDCSGSNIEIKALNPVYEFHPKLATFFSGYEFVEKEPALTVIGAGALGAQVILNSARSGFGREWKVIDEDRFFPHNIVRHALNGFHVGHHKSAIVCEIANSMAPGEDSFTGIVADVLMPGDKQAAVNEALSSADTILDMSASVTLSRHIVHGIESEAQRISLFLNPTGSDLVLLAEDSDRTIPLDTLEMQLYRAILNNEEMAGHFEAEDGRRRYGQSCRDISVKIPQDFVGLHAAIGAKAVRLAAGSDKSQITVWRASADHSVKRVEVEPQPVRVMQLGDWTLSIDEYVFTQLEELRAEKLPKETGGVLVGSFDLEFKMAYIVDTIPSPPDSKEWPTLYIRGCKGLEHRVKEIHKRTDGILHYVGEWHSHPEGCSTRPSDDDIEVFSWLTERMNAEGFPALMMIVGGNHVVNCFIGQIEKIENLIPRPER